MKVVKASDLKSKLQKKIEEGLRDIRAGKTMALTDYHTARFKKKKTRTA